MEAYHASYMSIHWWPREELTECREAIDRINRRIGYRLQMHKAVWPREVKLGEPFEIESEWSNGGVAPCYKGGYPCFTLKDARGGIVSVLVDDSLDVARLSVGMLGEVPKQSLKTACVVAPRFKVENVSFPGLARLERTICSCRSDGQMEHRSIGSLTRQMMVIAAIRSARLHW